VLALAERLAANCEKFPKSGQGLFTGSKQRYIVALPEDPAGPVSPSDWSGLRQRWRRGKLAYWKDRAALQQKAEAKGSLPLMSISKITYSRRAPLDVIVKSVEDGGSNELLLKFPSERIAEEWSSALTELRKILQTL